MLTPRPGFPGARLPIRLWRAGATVLDAVLPPRCMACGTLVGENGALCAACWSELSFITEPQCLQCGYPFEIDFGEPIRCGACLARPPAVDRARAAVAYDDPARAMIIAFKHGDRTDLGPGLARWLERVARPLFEDADVIVPVPLHRRRLWNRRYNQASILALALSRRAQVPVAPELLSRKRDTRSQGHLSPSARRRNIEGAFRVEARHRPALKGRRVLLVDDVHTTGITLEVCARTLKRAGAAAVDAVTLARVLRPTGVDD